MGFFDIFNKKHIRDKSKIDKNIDLQNETIKSQINILKESVDLVNTSNDLRTVIQCHELICKTIQVLMVYADDDLKKAGIVLNTPLLKILLDTRENKTVLINQGIQRNVQHILDGIKTLKEKQEVLDKLYIDLQGEVINDEENLNFLYELYEKQKLNLMEEISLTTMYTTDKTISCIEESSIGPNIATNIVYTDGSFEASIDLNKEMKLFYSLSEQIEKGANIFDRIDACEKSYELLTEFTKQSLKVDGDLPPVIACRDYGPNFYMKLGQWDKAELAIRKCIMANAYYPGNGTEELEYLHKFKEVAQKILDFIKKNPGYFQRDIYKVFNFTSEEKEIAKYFIKYSLQLKKEPYKNTNRLFIQTVND